MPATWELYGNSAGMIRNNKMLEKAALVIAFWDGSSKGTGHMIRRCIEKNIPLEAFTY